MTEHIQLIELNEIKRIRVTCKRCNASLMMTVDGYNIVKKCPRCGEEFGRLCDAFLDLDRALKHRDAVDNFIVQIELYKNDDEGNERD